jgi:hypothetical protein
MSGYDDTNEQKVEGFGFLTLHGGAEKTIADVGPPEVHPHHGERDGEDPGPGGPESEVQAVAAAPAEGGDGEPDEERDDGAGGREPGAVEAEVAGRPGEGQRGRQRLVLVDGLLLGRHGAPPRLRRASVARRRPREAAVPERRTSAGAARGEGRGGGVEAGGRVREDGEKARVEGRGEGSGGGGGHVEGKAGEL